ncbi:MAG: helix-turn-helix domain-containing protein [Armatimonadota bacterium]|nr:helix-turn-helix domain-containing protein [Armatimonadota bacterium]MDR7453365.1 helix-turn-helix domain-containing protein [Armatimonadota bacterium]MDR7456422.1 helix-turn-helix domain-containing protein [Armatimonadota bacterium]
MARGDRAPTGIGAALRAARAERGLSLAELQARTKIRARYLSALEEERFADLPPYPFARGFVQAVAVELGLDPAPLLDRLSAAVGGADQRAAGWQRLDSAIEPAVRPSRLRRLAMWAIGVVVVVGGALMIYFAQQLRELSRPATPVTAPQAATPAPAPAAGAPVEPAAAAPSPEAPGSRNEPPARADSPTAPGSGEAVAVDLEATGRSWLRVVVDGQEVFVGFITGGERRRWEARGSVAVRLGNAGAVAVTVNGRALGSLGGPGEVVTRVFRAGEAP